MRNGLTVTWLAAGIPVHLDELECYLHPQELLHAQSFVAVSKREEFLRSRYLYHAITEDPSPFIRAHGAIPVWPPHLRGSLTHKNGSIGLTSMPASSCLSLGIDAELQGAVTERLAKKIVIPREHEFLNSVKISDGLTLAFSFKESIFKALNPLTKKFLDFHDAEIVHLDEYCITAKLLNNDRAGGLTEISGCYDMLRNEDGSQFIITAALVPY